MWSFLSWLARHREFAYGDGTLTISANFPMIIHLRLPIVILLMLILPVAATADWYKQEQAIMGTRIAVEFWDEDKAHAEQCAEQVFSEMRRIDALMSPYKPNSELSRINQKAAGQAVRISEEMFNLLE